MKTLSTLVFLGILLLCSCSPEQENEKMDQKGDLIFDLSLSNANGQSRSILAIPAGSYLQINIETLEGEKILDDENIEILSFNGSYVSQALKLNIGEYILTEFLVISPNNEVLYATPISGSTMASLVKNSLPQSFEIKENSSVQLLLEVINVSLLLPQDIGYISFPFTVTDFFFLSVFKLDEEGNNLTYAKGYILQNKDTIKQFNIKPNINAVGLSNIGDDVFTLVIIKNGFSKHSENLTIERIFNTRENGLLNIQLEPALTFTAFRESGHDGSEDSNFEFSLNFEGELTINWGDGHIETKTSINDSYTTIGHKFEDDQKYFVTVKGDVDKISDFSSYYGMGPITEITLSSLPNLEYFSNGFTGPNQSPEVLDFSNNPKLTDVNVSNSSSLRQVKLKGNNSITYFDIGGENQISTAALDEIIGPIYNSVVKNGRMNGSIYIANFFDDPDPTVGPPSADAWLKLSVLGNDYNWEIITVYSEEKQ